MTRKHQRSSLAKLTLFLMISLFFSPCLAIPTPIAGLPKTTQADDIQYKDDWSLYLSPYIWFAGLAGHVNVRGIQAPFTNNFSKLRQNLDFSFGGRFEVSKGLWAFLLDPDYVKITQNPVVNGANANTTYETTMTDAGAYYRLYSQPVPRQGYLRASFELLGGGRVITFHSMIDTPINSTTSSISDTSSVVVPLLGARLKYNFNSKLHTWLTGEVGGFQVSHVSSTWSTALGISYNFTQHFDLSLAYKALAVNYSIQAITINTLLQGPILGLGYSW